MAEEEIVEFEEDGKKKHSGKGTKVTTFVLGIINLCILVFTILFFSISLNLKNQQAEDAGEAIALIFVIIIFYTLPLLFVAANIAIGIPGVVTGAVSVKRSEKKTLSIIGLVMNGVAMVTAIILTIMLFI